MVSRFDDYQDLSPQVHSGKLSIRARMRLTDCGVLLYVYYCT